MKIEKQICMVSLFTDIVDRELKKYLAYHRELKKWEEKGMQDWNTRPKEVPKSRLKDRMKILRQEMIKLDKML